MVRVNETEPDDPEAVTYRVTTYWKRRKGQAGLTQASSRRLDISEALDWILADLPEDAWTLTSEFPDNGGLPLVTIKIDWGAVPDGVRSPVIPARNGRRP